jgi:hypothetical protein
MVMVPAGSFMMGSPVSEVRGDGRRVGQLRGRGQVPIVWSNCGARQAPGSPRFLERHHERLPALALAQDRRDLPAADRGGVGVRDPGGHYDTVLNGPDDHARAGEL